MKYLVPFIVFVVVWFICMFEYAYRKDKQKMDRIIELEREIEVLKNDVDSAVSELRVLREQNKLLLSTIKQLTRENK